MFCLLVDENDYDEYGEDEEDSEDEEDDEDDDDDEEAKIMSVRSEYDLIMKYFLLLLNALYGIVFLSTL